MLSYRRLTAAPIPVHVISRRRCRRVRPSRYNSYYEYHYSSSSKLCSAEEVTPTGIPTANPNFVDSTQAPSTYCPKSALVYENAVTEAEAKAVVQDIESRTKRRRYEKGHWDAVITQYKEIELPLPSESSSPASTAAVLSDTSIQVIERIRNQLELQQFGPNGAADQDGRTKNIGGVKWISCHGIDLKREGLLTAHVDSVRYSGLIVAGLSLLSSSIMRLRPAAAMDDTSTSSGGSGGEDHDGNNSKSLYEPKPTEAPDDGQVDLYLPPLSLYVLSGISRYRYTHELLPCGSKFATRDGTGDAKSIEVSRDRRISVIFRDAKD